MRGLGNWAALAESDSSCTLSPHPISGVSPVLPKPCGMALNQRRYGGQISFLGIYVRRLAWKSRYLFSPTNVLFTPFGIVQALSYFSWVTWIWPDNAGESTTPFVRLGGHVAHIFLQVVAQLFGYVAFFLLVALSRPFADMADGGKLHPWNGKCDYELRCG